MTNYSKAALEVENRYLKRKIEELEKENSRLIGVVSEIQMAILKSPTQMFWNRETEGNPMRVNVNFGDKY